MKTLDYTLPDYLASYLINNDPSSLEDNEIEEIDTFIKNEGKEHKLFYCVNVSDDESDFRTSNDLNNLGGNVLTYTFQIE